MAPQEDPLRRIAESLANLERLYADSLRRQEEQAKLAEERHKILDESQRVFDERQKRWAKQDEKLDKLGFVTLNPWLQPGQLAYFLTALALFVLSITILFLNRR